MGRGEWYRWDKKDTTDDYLSLPINFVRKRWGLDRMMVCTMLWHIRERQVGEIQLVILPGQGVRLHYRFNGEPVESLVRFTTTAQHLGGVRHWWVCPRCGRRCGVLYGGRYFWCRQCRNLTYATTQQGGSLVDTIDNKLYRLRKKLQATDRNIMDGPPLQKPPHMHGRTFDRLCQEWINLLQVRRTAMLSEMVDLLHRHGQDLGLDVSPEDVRKEAKFEWEMHKQDPAHVSRWELRRRYAALLDPSPKRKRPERLTLGELAQRAEVPYAFAREVQTQGLIAPDAGRTKRRKRYRPKLASWLGKLHTLREAGLTWEEIRDWTQRRFAPGHEHERAWPAGVAK